MLRWIVAVTGAVLSAAIAFHILHRTPIRADMLHVLCLMLTAVTAYSWMLFGRTGSLLAGAAGLMLVVWAWGAGQAAALTGDLLALVALSAAAAWQQHRRGARFTRMAQVIEDLDEEATVKEQAIDFAEQTREALQRKHDRYAQLQSIAASLSNMTDLAAIGDFIVERAFTLIGKSDACLLFLVDRQQQQLSLSASKRRGAAAPIRAKHGDQFDRHVLRSQRPLLVNDVRRDFRFTWTAQERPVQAVIAAPLVVHQHADGLLRLDAPTANVYTQDDLRFLDILLHLAGTAVTNARLFAQTQQLALTDGLTGLLLRRPFLEQLTRELTRAGRGREPASVLMLDVDHFKSYNDTFGHTAGDVVLKTVAEVMRASVPPDGACARYGGEEFAVLLPRSSRTQAADTAEAIRQAVEQASKGGRSQRPVTVSIGVASFPDDAQSELELIRVADGRLYQAKRGGRNLVCST